MVAMTLGLDLGTNSIGWALLEHDESNLPKRIIGCGARVFQEAVEAKTRAPKNATRRAARSLRRTLARRKMRRNALISLLTTANLLPRDEASRNALLSGGGANDPYALRKRALDEKLSLHEMGRVLYHLCRRRGFKSNRKAQLAAVLTQYPAIQEILRQEEAAEAQAAEARFRKRAERALASGKPPPSATSSAEDDEGIIKAAISQLRKDMSAAGSRTLGEYLAGLPKKRNVHTDRAMYEEEFEAIWKVQSAHRPVELNDSLKARAFRTIFFQRPLKTQKFLVGRCPHEPTRKRAPKALLDSQRFRLLQDINHLTVKNPVTRVDRPLDQGERLKLYAALQVQETMTWGGVRKLLGLHSGEKFNLELGGKEKLIGNRVEVALSKALPEIWPQMPDHAPVIPGAPQSKTKENLLIDLLTIDRKDALIKRALEHWGFTPEQAYRLAVTELEPGYLNLSVKAIRKLLPHLRAGLNYHDACQKADYLREDQKPKGALNTLPEPQQMRNPVVQKALYEARKVINAIVRRWGKPTVVRVELARDMKLNRLQREALKRQNRANEKLNETARQALTARGIGQPTRDDLIKYRLWVECEGVCPYTGQAIGIDMLFTPAVDVEHVIPYSLCLDDSYMNKTLCIATENRQIKRQQTPYDAYSGNVDRYREILTRLSHMPLMPAAKARKFEIKEVDTDDFISRQLNDTRYISVEVKNYLKKLGCEVEVSKGSATAMVRHVWGLNRILSPDAKNNKNRADHRHHAIDAAVIAVTNRHLFQLMSRAAKADSSHAVGRLNIPKPWASFGVELSDAISEVAVSHAPSRKISGALLEDTAYGYSEKDKCFAYRKPLSSLKTAAEIEKIRDQRVRALVQERLADCKGDFKRAFGDPSNPVLHADGKTPIRSVRLAVTFDPKSVYGVRRADGVAYKFFKYGNNHHVEIIENVKTGKRKGIYVTALAAARRARSENRPIVGRDQDEGWRFVMSLAVNDLVEVLEGDISQLYRVQKLSGVNDAITLRLATAATLENDGEQINKTSNTLRGRKVMVDPLGAIRPCND